MMLEYNEEGKLILQNTPIVNIKTQSKYISDDMEVIDIDGEKYLNSKYSFNKIPPKVFKLDTCLKFPLLFPQTSIVRTYPCY